MRERRFIFTARARRARAVCERCVLTSKGSVRQRLRGSGAERVTELQEPLAQRAQLSASTAGARCAQAQLLHEHVGGSRQQSTQLVGEEAPATRAVDLQPVVQLFDPILDLPARAVDVLVQLLRRGLEVGDEEARIVLLNRPVRRVVRGV